MKNRQKLMRLRHHWLLYSHEDDLVYSEVIDFVDNLIHETKNAGGWLYDGEEE